MKEYCHTSLPWFTLGEIIGTDAGFIVQGLIVRWNETIGAVVGPEGQQTQYSYDAHKFDLELPIEVAPGPEAVEYYLEAGKDGIIEKAKTRLTQKEGFDDAY